VYIRRCLPHARSGRDENAIGEEFRGGFGPSVR
jgi:hypothetical protein